AVQAGEHEGPRAVVRGLVEAPADQRHGTPCVQRTTLDAPLAAFARLLQRRVQPPDALSVAPEARLRGPVQARLGRHAEGVRWLDAALEQARKGGERGVESRALNARGAMSLVSGRLDEAADYCTRALMLASLDG